MGREISGTSATVDTSKFYPMVGIRDTVGQFVKGKVLRVAATKNNNPVIDLELIDLNGSSTISKSKGVYAETDVKIGDIVSLIGTTKQLQEKLPQLAVGDIVTVTFTGTQKVSKGTMKNYSVIVE
jgi:RecJ-like exonuclease